MKHFFYLILLSFCLTFITSCKKHTDAPAPSNKADIAAMMNKKWSTSIPAARTATDPTASDFASFEFNASGNYFIIMADKSMVTGTFTVHTADSIVTLFNGSSTTSQYGTLSISSITATQFVFQLTLNATVTPIDISTVAVTTSVGTSSDPSVNNTTKLARSWKVDTYIQGTSSYTITAPLYAYAVFTENGTYWTETYNGTGTAIKNSGQWKWTDATQTQICTSSTDVAPVCSGSGASITFDSNGNLIMSSTPTGQSTTTYYFSELTQ